MRKLDKKLSKKFQKSLSDVICRIKSQTPNLRIAFTTSKLINGCRRPQSLPLYANGHRLRRRKNNQTDDSESETAASESAAAGRRTDKTEATLEDIDRFLFENFRSLYSDKYEPDREEEDGDEEAESTPATYDSSYRSFETPDLTPSELCVSELCVSRQFFVSQASSASVTDEARTSLALSDDAGGIASTITAASAARSAFLKSDPARGLLEKATSGGGGKEKSLPSADCIAVLKASANPIEDFRRSMGQVMEARARNGKIVDWSFMEELLFCYLRLNEKKYYRFVLDAFVDSVVDMRRNSCDGGVSGGATEERWRGRRGKTIKC